MLKLCDVKKDYASGDSVVPALRGIDLTFRRSEFVSILGPSGCGKTTLLNIIGGLDKYTSGDLVIDGVSTKDYKDGDWDSYRNGTIGFVFQSYNLIPHLSILDNVAIALTLSGVSASERNKRAQEVLEKVGLSDHLHKRPNQLSGGQMQRVAIARALVNNPRILLADEPTGALDSLSSEQIMQLIKSVSKDRLVIMVTHNGDIAKQYSDRTIRLLDGRVVEDTAGFVQEVEPEETAVADVCQGAEDGEELGGATQENIGTDTKKQKGKGKRKKTAMSYPTALKLSFKNLLTKKARTIITSIAGSIGIIGVALVLAISSGMTSYVNRMQSDTLSGFPITISERTSLSMISGQPDYSGTGSNFPDDGIIHPSNPGIHINKFDEEYFEYLKGLDVKDVNSIDYAYSAKMNLVYKTDTGVYKLLDNVSQSGNPLMGASNSLGWQQLPSSVEFLSSQYELLAGEGYPNAEGEIALIVNKNNTISNSLFTELGIPYTTDSKFEFSDFVGRKIRVVSNNDFYSPVGDGTYRASVDYDALFNDDTQQMLTVTSVLRIKEDSSSSLLSSGLVYTSKLTDKMIADSLSSDIAAAQKADPTKNILTGETFSSPLGLVELMRYLGGDATPNSISIFPKTFDGKERVKTYLNAYNEGKPTEDKILYADLADMITVTVSTLISTISAVLTAFAAISLVVSTIMIGIITYVSVVERTKEIGILRSLGARKKDISRVFNAETLIIGFAAGVIGIVLTLVLSIPVNLIVQSITGIAGIAKLPVLAGFGLVVLSMLLTLVGGLIPSTIASKRDPVRALRTE